MKRTGALILLAALAVIPLFAGETYRSAFLLTWESGFDGATTPDSRTEDSNMIGFEMEYISRNLGYGMDALAGFRKDSQERSLMDWQGQLFLRYHLFGGESFIDPFLEGGIGNTGTFRLKDGGGLKMSLYPFVSAGINLVFRGGFYAGGRWSWRMDEWEIPGTGYPLNGNGNTEFTLILGKSYSAGCRSCGDRHYHCK